MPDVALLCYLAMTFLQLNMLIDNYLLDIVQKTKLSGPKTCTFVYQLAHICQKMGENAGYKLHIDVAS